MIVLLYNSSELLCLSNRDCLALKQVSMFVYLQLLLDLLPTRGKKSPAVESPSPTPGEGQSVLLPTFTPSPHEPLKKPSSPSGAPSLAAIRKERRAHDRKHTSIMHNEL